jgi:hypothetical protein
MASKKSYLTKNISHLFWNKYSHKVVVEAKKVHSGWRTEYDRNKELKTITKHCPSAESDTWRFTSGYRNITLFFQNENDFQNFLSNFRGKVTEVWVPINEKQTEILEQDHKVVFRKKPYFDKYDWCITLSYLDRASRDEVVQWTEGTFDSTSTDRLYLSRGRQLRFYLKDEEDIVLIKLTQGSRVKKIEKAVLTTTITNETE